MSSDKRVYRFPLPTGLDERNIPGCQHRWRRLVAVQDDRRFYVIDCLTEVETQRRILRFRLVYAELQQVVDMRLIDGEPALLPILGPRSVSDPFAAVYALDVQRLVFVRVDDGQHVNRFLVHCHATGHATVASERLVFSAPRPQRFWHISGPFQCARILVFGTDVEEPWMRTEPNAQLFALKVNSDDEALDLGDPLRYIQQVVGPQNYGAPGGPEYRLDPRLLILGADGRSLFGPVVSHTSAIVRFMLGFEMRRLPTRNVWRYRWRPSTFFGLTHHEMRRIAIPAPGRRYVVLPQKNSTIPLHHSYRLFDIQLNEHDTGLWTTKSVALPEDVRDREFLVLASRTVSHVLSTTTLNEEIRISTGVVQSTTLPRLEEMAYHAYRQTLPQPLDEHARKQLDRVTRILLF